MDKKSYLLEIEKATCKILIAWCSLRDSNPRPPPCDGDALPTELSEQIKKNLVGLTELESVTSSMSTRHSNHLSYNPTSLSRQAQLYPLRFKLSRKTFYLISTVAPTSSSLALRASASAFEIFSLTGAGAPSTRAFASLSPRLVASRTALMTLIFS